EGAVGHVINDLSQFNDVTRRLLEESDHGLPTSFAPRCFTSLALESEHTAVTTPPRAVTTLHNIVPTPPLAASVSTLSPGSTPASCITSAAVCPAIPSPALADAESESGFNATASAGTEMYSASVPAPTATLLAGMAPQTTEPTSSLGDEALTE